MKVIRLYAGEDGESHFDEIDIPTIDSGRGGQHTEVYQTNRGYFW